ncbi:MAG TPA: glycoside hydrolase family 9 protein [Longimicrobiales bacterium]
MQTFLPRRATRLAPARALALAPAVGLAVVPALAVVLTACHAGAVRQAGPDAGGAWDARPDTVPALHVRVNQVGYLPAAPKVAVVCALEWRDVRTFDVVAANGDVVLGPAPAERAAGFGPCVETYRLDFSALRTEGEYRIRLGDAGSDPRGAGSGRFDAAPRGRGAESRGGDTASWGRRVVSPPVRIAADAYAGAADTLLMYLRQQRSGFNPLFRDSVHHRTDGILVDHPTRAGEFVPVAGGWADAADYLQYVTTSANATFVLLMAYRDHPAAFADEYDADGLPAANGVPDVLDEARHGLEWLVKMYPEDDLLLNQLGDDRDHAFPDLPVTDSSDYGWGKGGYRPVYPCTGRPQGLLEHRNRSDGYASTAGKMASAMALGAMLLEERDPAFAAVLRRKALTAYALGREHPGVCQTAPAAAPYFYEEDNWVDDMELAAAELHALTGEPRYLREALAYARREPVTPWMGRDTARHYQWYPWHNNGHHEVWRLGGEEEKRRMAEFYRRGLEAVAARADNGFRVGIPFIWCSNDLMASFATQALLYRRMTGDDRFLEYETAALDWLFGTNPWGVSMVVGYPARATTPRDPHSIVARELGVETQTGGLVDGPVYRSIFENLLYIRLFEPDEYAPFNTGSVVYHDDFGDYSTNEPIMDGTANLAYLLSALAPPTSRPLGIRRDE